MRIARWSLGLAALGWAAAPVLSADSGRWIHVRVIDEGSRGARVDVQVPLTMVAALMPTFESKIDLDGTFDIGRGEMSLDEMRQAWAAVKAGKDGNYVTIQEGGETVRIAKRGGIVHVDVTGKRSEKVKVRLPAALVDAVLGQGDKLDVSGLARALDDVPSGELISVDDDESKVRVWIDDRPSPVDEP